MNEEWDISGTEVKRLRVFQVTYRLHLSNLLNEDEADFLSLSRSSSKGYPEADHSN